MQIKAHFASVNVIIAIALLWLAVGILCSVAAQGDVEQLIYIDKGISKDVIVDSVFDGDTIEVRDKDGFTDKVRLLGIDTPEVGNPDEGTVDEPFAQKAKNFTFQLVSKTVTLYISINQPKDDFGRTLGVIVYRDEVFNTKLLENGLATRLFLKNDLINYPVWEAKEVAARKANLGLWRNIGSKGVVINEINPNPKGKDNEQGEFAELFNGNLTPVDVSRWTFGDGREATIPEGTVIPARGYLILSNISVRDFRTKYPNTPDSAIIINPKGFILQNSFTPPQGLVKHLKDANRAYQDSLTYNLKWDGRGADGTGRSLERVLTNVVNVGDSTVDGADDENWNASIALFGAPGSSIALVSTPGYRNSVSPPYPRWDVNEDGVVDISDLVLVGQHFGEDYRYDIPVTPLAMPQAFVSVAKPVLLQNYPNPFNPETWIPYMLPTASDVILEIYTATGQLARRMEIGHQIAGFYVDKDRAIHWDGANDNGEKATNGVYFYTLRAGSLATTKRMLLVR